MRRAFSTYKPKINFSYETMSKGKRRKVAWMFGIGLGGAALSVYSKYFNSEIDVVYQDSDLMDSIVPRMPALFKVSSAHQPYFGTSYLPFRFMEIIYCAIAEPRPYVRVREERILTPHGDTLELGNDS